MTEQTDAAEVEYLSDVIRRHIPTLPQHAMDEVCDAVLHSRWLADYRSRREAAAEARGGGTGAAGGGCVLPSHLPRSA